MLTATSIGFQAFFAGGQDTSTRASSVVDVYNGKLHEWKVMALSVARCVLTWCCWWVLVLFARVSLLRYNLASAAFESSSHSQVLFAGGK
jgi:hypothetical protein